MPRQGLTSLTTPLSGGYFSANPPPSMGGPSGLFPSAVAAYKAFAPGALKLPTVPQPENELDKAIKMARLKNMLKNARIGTDPKLGALKFSAQASYQDWLATNKELGASLEQKELSRKNKDTAMNLYLGYADAEGKRVDTEIKQKGLQGFINDLLRGIGVPVPPPLGTQIKDVGNPPPVNPQVGVNVVKEVPLSEWSVGKTKKEVFDEATRRKFPSNIILESKEYKRAR